MGSKSRDDELEQLRRSIAEGDFAAAEQLLRSVGQGRQRRQGEPRDGRTGGDSEPSLGDPCEAASGAETASRDAVDARAPGEASPLERECPGQEAKVATAKGEMAFWRVRCTLRQFSPDDASVAADCAAVLRGARQQFDELAASAELCHAANARPEDLLFMDTETCGLSAMAVFLVGLMFFRDEELVFEQYFARDYAEEPAILQAFNDRVPEAGVLVTFNGRAFDVPLIAERSVVHGLAEPWCTPPHLDLLIEVRRRWRKRLPNCRMQTLEERFFSERRMDDIPSSQIPDAYHEFVRTADARAIGKVLAHNRRDLLTMSRMVCLLLTGCDPIPG